MTYVVAYFSDHASELFMSQVEAESELDACLKFLEHNMKIVNLTDLPSFQGINLKELTLEKLQRDIIPNWDATIEVTKIR